VGVDELLAELAVVKAENTALKAELEEIKRLLRRNSTNSSAPPSTDPPDVKRPKKETTGKKRGGQQGHKGNTRLLVPASKVVHVVEHAIEGACKCGCTEVKLRAPERRQVVELPEIKPDITEHRAQRGWCEGCGRRRRAVLPSGVPSGMLGPRAQAFIASLTGAYQLSRRDAVRFLAENLGLKVSLGTVSNTEAAVSEALAPAWEQAREHMRAAPMKNLDETTHAGPEGRTAWVGSTPEATCLQVGLDRSRVSLVAFLGVIGLATGIIGTDRYLVYDCIPTARRQLCWAHIVRAFQALVDDGGEHARVGTMLLDLTRQVLHAWNEWKRGRKKRDEIEPVLRRSRADLERLLSTYIDLPGLRTLAHAFVLTPESVWLFTTNAAVEPTNNRAERDLRMLVMWRRTSFGTQSVRGDRFLERILTVTQTLRRHGTRLLDFLVDSVQARLVPSAAPRLLPSR
jgi:transposase